MTLQECGDAGSANITIKVDFADGEQAAEPLQRGSTLAARYLLQPEGDSEADILYLSQTGGW